MSELVTWLKAIYAKAQENNFEWKPLYPNNMPCNGKEGIYTEVWFEKEGKYEYLKFTIEYAYRCDEECTSHPEEGIKYYVLHKLRLTDLEEKFEIPEPSDHFQLEGLSCMVNDYGAFQHVFDDEETAKKVAANLLKMRIYPYLYILSDEEVEEWNQFMKQYEK